MSRETHFDPRREVPLVEEDTGLMTGLPCAGCGARERVKGLLLKTVYQQGENGRQVIPLCELCSLDLGMQLFHIWNPQAGVA